MSYTHENAPTANELFDLTGKNALITGGTGWLGGALSRALAEAGASVIISSSRDAGAAQKSADELPRPAGQKHHGIKLDHMDETSITQGFKDALGKVGQLDILVNNGLARTNAMASIEDMTAQAFTDHQQNNTGYFLVAREMHRQAVERGIGASIIMIGSMYGVVGSYPDAYEGVSFPSPVAYHALKGGTIHMTRHLAVYWAKDNVRVNALSPGAFPPDTIHPEMTRRLCTKTPMRRMGLPHELKGALLLFASDAGSYITGQNLLVDGGWTAW